jgi:hypothetical protein
VTTANSYSQHGARPQPTQPIKDVPFEQTTAKIFVYANITLATADVTKKISANLPTGWDRLPFDAALQVAYVPSSPGAGLASFLVLTPTQGAWTLDVPARGSVDGKVSFKRVDDRLGLKVDATMRVAFHPTSRGTHRPVSVSACLPRY